MHNQLHRKFHFLVLLTLSIIAYTLFFELNRLDPTNINWLFKVRGDWAQHYLGWDFFRKESWQFPLGNFSRYNYPIGSNIVYTDSIPLLALFFKSVEFLLPKTFQYFGLWIFICVFLNGFFSFKLLKFYNVKTFYIYVFVFLIMINPVLIFRTMHPALSAHWLIIGAIYFYVSSTNAKKYDKRLNYTLFFFVLSGLISPYLTLFMVGFVIIMFLQNLLFIKHISVLKTILKTLLSSVILLALWYSIGALGGNENIASEGSYNFYGMNLNSFYNSRGRALFFPDFPIYREHQFEGFMYLGVGIMILILLTTVLFVINFNRVKSVFTKQNSLLFILALLFAVFSISHEVTFNDKLLFTIPFMDKISPIANIFRACGRYFWLGYYLILFFSFVIFFKAKINQYVIYVLLIFIVGIQLYDIQPLFRDANYKVGKYVSDLNNHNWETLFKNHKRIITLPFYKTTIVNRLDYQEFCYYASKFNNQITTGYTARSDKKAQQKFKNEAINRIALGVTDKNTMYIATKKMLPYFYQLYKTNSINVRAIDDYYAIYVKDENITSLLNFISDEKEKTTKAIQEIENQKKFKEIQQSEITSDDIKYHIENFYYKDNFIDMSGWAFLKNKNNNIGDSISIILKNSNKTYKIIADLTPRPDVTSVFNAENLEDSGFKLFSFLENIQGGNYTVLLSVKNKRTAKELVVKTNKLLILKPFFKPILMQRNISEDINFTGNIDGFKHKKDIITINGWVISKGISSNSISKSLLLINEKNQYSIPIITENRKDVTEYFKNKFDYNQSGFKTTFKTENLPKGNYKIAIALENKKTKEIGFYQTTKVFEVK